MHRVLYEEENSWWYQIIAKNIFGALFSITIPHAPDPDATELPSALIQSCSSAAWLAESGA